MENHEKVFIGIMFALLLTLAAMMYNEFYLSPLTSEVANKVCQEKGFDQYKSYQRVFFSTVPLGVQCENAPKSIFVENQ